MTAVQAQFAKRSPCRAPSLTPDPAAFERPRVLKPDPDLDKYADRLLDRLFGSLANPNVFQPMLDRVEILLAKYPLQAKENLHLSRGSSLAQTCGDDEEAK